MKILFCAAWGFLLASCGPADLAAISKPPAEQPAVLSVTPPDGAGAFDGNQIEVGVSKALDPQTISTKSFIVTTVPEGNVDVSSLLKDVSKEKVKGLDGVFEVAEDKKSVRFKASAPFPSGARLGVLLTPTILSSGHFPLAPFFSSFYVKGSAVGNGTGQVAADAAAPAGTTALPEVIRPSYLYLNEIFYDEVGSDTEGTLFIELVGEKDQDISDFQLVMVNGSDGKTTDTIKIPKGLKMNSEGLFVIADAVTGQPGVTKVLRADYVINFDPPNGPDCIQLLNPEGERIDGVGYGSPLVLRGDNKQLCYDFAPALDAPSGKSLVRRQFAIGIQKDNSQDWMILDIPTPGILDFPDQLGVGLSQKD